MLYAGVFGRTNFATWRVEVYTRWGNRVCWEWHGANRAESRAPGIESMRHPACQHHLHLASSQPKTRRIHQKSFSENKIRFQIYLFFLNLTNMTWNYVSKLFYQKLIILNIDLSKFKFASTRKQSVHFMITSGFTTCLTDSLYTIPYI